MVTLDRFMVADLIGMIDEAQHIEGIQSELQARLQFIKEYLEFELDYLRTEEKDMDVFSD